MGTTVAQYDQRREGRLRRLARRQGLAVAKYRTRTPETLTLRLSSGMTLPAPCLPGRHASSTSQGHANAEMFRNCLITKREERPREARFQYGGAAILSTSRGNSPRTIQVLFTRTPSPSVDQNGEIVTGRRPSLGRVGRLPSSHVVGGQSSRLLASGGCSTA